MAHVERDYERTRETTRISWGAILAGGVAALAISALLNLLGIGFGFTAIDPLTESDPLSGIGTGTMIWLILSNLIALFAGGMVAGRMAGFISKADGGLHGFLSWCVVTAVTLFLITTTVGAILSGVSGAVSSVFGGGNEQTVVRVEGPQQQAQAQNQQGISFSNIEDKFLQLINRAEQYDILSGNTAQKVRETLNQGTADIRNMWQELNLDQNIDQFLNDLSVEIDDEGNLNISVEGDYINREKIENYLAENTDLSEQEIDQRITEWNQNIEQAINEVEGLYQEAKQEVEEFSDQLADTIATISFISFFVLLFGAIAAYGGGMLAAKSNPAVVEEEHYERHS